MYAQHLLRGSGNGEFYLLRGSHTNHMLLTPEGWRIERIIQHRSREYGNTSALTEAAARSRPALGRRDPPYRRTANGCSRAIHPPTSVARRMKVLKAG